MKGLILINAYSSLESFLYQSKRMKAELEDMGVETDIRRNDFFAVGIEEGQIKSNLSGYDFVIYLDKDMYMSKLIEDAGIRLFNSHKSIRLCDDKMLTHITLAKNNIAMPDALSGLLCYDSDAKISENTVTYIGDKLGYPVIAKERYGSLVKGVYKADNIGELRFIMNTLKMKPHFFERYISSSAGKDVRVIVVGDRAIACMQRRSEHDFRSNIELGGRGEKVELSREFEDIAIRAAKALGLIYAGVDILYGEGGKPVVCEVNSNAFFGEIERVSGINVARAYAEEIVRLLK